MKPAAFEYERPTSLEEALGILSERADDAKLLAGGQSLVPLMNFRLARPECLIDLNRISTLSSIEQDADGSLRIGAMTRLAQLERANGSLSGHPLLQEAVRLVGHFQIRNRGTVGGSVAHADPAAELPATLLALDATVVIRSVRGERTVPATELFVGPFTTLLEPDEILTEVRFPAQPRATSAIVEFARRPGDFALAGAICHVVADTRTVSAIRLALFGVAATPIRLPATEQSLLGTTPDTDTIRGDVEAALNDVSIVSDLHGSETYRKGLAAELAASAVMRALERAEEGEQRR